MLNKKQKIRLISGLTTVLLIFAIVACLFLTLQSLSKGYVSIGGISIFRVVTGSMEPTVPKGALLISKKQDISTIKINDIICFRTNDKVLGHATITHRVINIYKNPDGSIMLQTKGDANPTADATLVSGKQLIGRVIKHTGDDSKMSAIIKFLTQDFGFIACILLPVLIVAAWVFKDAVKSMKTAIDSMKEQLDKKPAVTLTSEEYSELYKEIENEVRKELEQNETKAELCDKAVKEGADGCCEQDDGVGKQAASTAEGDK